MGDPMAGTALKNKAVEVTSDAAVMTRTDTLQSGVRRNGAPSLVPH
jgi:hypothetical protein